MGTKGDEPRPKTSWEKWSWAGNVIETPARRLQSHCNARTRIEEIAQRIADEIEGKHSQHHGERWEKHKLRSVEQVGAAIVEHGSPTGGGGSYTQTQKTHGGFSENGARHADRCLHNYGLNNVEIGRASC